MVILKFIKFLIYNFYFPKIENNFIILDLLLCFIDVWPKQMKQNSAIVLLQHVNGHNSNHMNTFEAIKPNCDRILCQIFGSEPA